MSKYKNSTRKVPMSPEALPQQRLVLVDELPNRPDGLLLITGPIPDQIVPRVGSSEDLCQLEWSWSPMHSRVQLWSICESVCGKFLILTTGLFNDESLFCGVEESDEEIKGPEPWDFHCLGYCQKIDGISLRDHAVLLLIDALKQELSDTDLDPYHWINATDLLDCSDLEAISREVWPDA